MITPAYAPTATERVLPRLALDFTTGVLDPRVTVTRALNTATRVNSSGFIEAVNANLPRFDYDPVTLAPKGLLIEEARSNIVLQSAAISTPWVVDGGASLGATVLAPDNTNAAKLFKENGSNTYFRMYQTLTLANNTAHTLSFFAKPSGRNWLYIYVNGGNNTAYVDIANKTVGTTLGSPTIKFVSYANGFVRVEFTFTNTTSTSQNVQIWLASANNSNIYQGDNVSGAYVWGVQMEAGAFATSYIPTTTTSLTRNADVVQMTGTNFSSWFNGSEGAFMAQWLQGPVSTTKVGGVLECVGSVRSPQTTSGVVFYGQNGGSVLLGASTANALYKVAYAYKTGTVERVAINGGATASNSVNYSTVPTLLTLGHLASVTNFWVNSWMQKLYYWPQSLTSPEVQAFSK